MTSLSNNSNSIAVGETDVLPASKEALTKVVKTGTIDSGAGAVSEVSNAIIDGESRILTATAEIMSKTAITETLNSGTRECSEVSSSVIHSTEQSRRPLLHHDASSAGLDEDSKHHYKTNTQRRAVSAASTAAPDFVDRKASLSAAVDSHSKRILMSHSFASVDNQRYILASASSLSSVTWAQRSFDLHYTPTQNFQSMASNNAAAHTSFNGVNSEPLPLFDRALIEVEGFLTAPVDPFGGCVCIYDHLPVPPPAATKVRLRAGALSSSPSHPFEYFNFASDSDDTKGSKSETGLQYNAVSILNASNDAEARKSSRSWSVASSLVSQKEKSIPLSPPLYSEQERQLQGYVDLELGGSTKHFASAKPLASSGASFVPPEYYIINNNNSRPSNKEALLKPVDTYHQGLSIPYSLSKQATFSSGNKKKKKRNKGKVWEQTQKMLARTHVGFHILTMERRRLKTALLFVMLPVWMAIWTAVYSAIEGVRGVLFI